MFMPAITVICRFGTCFGTYNNPPTYQGECGFEPPREQQVMSMLLMKDVNVVSSTFQSEILNARYHITRGLFCIAALQLVGFRLIPRGSRAWHCDDSKPAALCLQHTTALKPLRRAMRSNLLNTKMVQRSLNAFMLMLTFTAGLVVLITSEMPMERYLHGPVLAANDAGLIDSIAYLGFVKMAHSFKVLHQQPSRCVIESKPHDPQKPVWRHEFRCP